MDMQVDVWGNLDSFEHVKANPILMMSEQENFMLSRKRFVFIMLAQMLNWNSHKSKLLH